jgi:hypothetical protein
MRSEPVERCLACEAVVTKEIREETPCSCLRSFGRAELGAYQTASPLRTLDHSVGFSDAYRSIQEIAVPMLSETQFTLLAAIWGILCGIVFFQLPSQDTSAGVRRCEKMSPRAKMRLCRHIEFFKSPIYCWVIRLAGFLSICRITCHPISSPLIGSGS